MSAIGASTLLLSRGCSRRMLGWFHGTSPAIGWCQCSSTRPRHPERNTYRPKLGLLVRLEFERLRRRGSPAWRLHDELAAGPGKDHASRPYYLAPSARALEFSATVLDRPASSSRWFSCRAMMVARPARAPSVAVRSPALAKLPSPSTIGGVSCVTCRCV